MALPKRPKRATDESDESYRLKVKNWRREYDRIRRQRQTPEARARLAAVAKATKTRLGKDHLKASRRSWYEANRDRESESAKRWLAANPDAKSRYNARYRKKHAEKLTEYFRSPEHLARVRQRQRARYASDLNYHIMMCLRSAMTQAVRLYGHGKRGRSTTLLGCPIEHVIKHLESQFVPGMSWDNHGEWHIDHRRPCASFDLTDPAQQRECFHFSNLQPLWKAENISKGARL